MGRIPFGFTPTERGVFAARVDRPRAAGRLHQRGGDRRLRRRRADDRDRAAGQHPPRARRGSAAGGADPADALHLPRPAGRAIPRRADPAGRRRRPPVSRPAAWRSTPACSTASTSAGSWPPTIHGWAPAGLLDTYDDERHLAAERTLLHTRAQVALRRGHDAAAVALRELFQELVADEQPLRRLGALIAGTDVRYPTPNPDDHAADRHLRARPRPAHRQAAARRAHGAAGAARPRRPPGPPRGRRWLAASRRRPHRRRPTTGRPTPS